MEIRSLQRVTDSRVLAHGDDFALLSTFVSELPNTLLVQLLRGTFGARQTFSLYAVYREGGMTFDAIIRFDIAEHGKDLQDVLQHFVDGVAFEAAVLGSLRKEVGHHFRR